MSDLIKFYLKKFCLFKAWDELLDIRSHQANFTAGTNMRPEANFNSKFSLLAHLTSPASSNDWIEATIK